MESLQSPETTHDRTLKIPQSPHCLQKLQGESEMVGFLPVLEILHLREAGVTVKVFEALLTEQDWEEGCLRSDRPDGHEAARSSVRAHPAANGQSYLG